MIKIFFKFATFWWFCLLEIPLSAVSAPHFTFRDMRLAVCHCPCIRSMQKVWDIFFRFVCRDRTSHCSQDIASIFFGRQSMTCPLFAYSLSKISEIHKIINFLLFRCFQTTPMNAITWAEIFYSIPNEQQASDLQKPSRANTKSTFDFVSHSDSKAEVKNNLTFHSESTLGGFRGMFPNHSHECNECFQHSCMMFTWLLSYVIIVTYLIYFVIFNVIL